MSKYIPKAIQENSSLVREDKQMQKWQKQLLENLEKSS